MLQLIHFPLLNCLLLLIDGTIRVYNASTGVEEIKMSEPKAPEHPTVMQSLQQPAFTSIRFRPEYGDNHNRSRNVFITANTAGKLQHWHMSSGKCIYTQEDAGNQLYIADYDNEGNRYVTAGRDHKIRIYDEATKSLTHTLEGGTGLEDRTHGHNNRIFACKFVPHNSNLVISGGWDNTVVIWDIRMKVAVRSIYGPHICGDALDMVGSEILTGSWRPHNQLEIWDFSKGTKIQDIHWNGPDTMEGQKPCMVYAAQFSKEGRGRFIVAGGSNSNEAKVYDHSCNDEVIGTVHNLSGGVFCADWCPVVQRSGSQLLALAGGDSAIRILEVFENPRGDI